MENKELQVRKSFTGRSNQKDIHKAMLDMLKARDPSYNDMTENDLLYVLTEAVSFAISGLNYRMDKSYLALNPKTADTESAKANIISSYGGSLDFYRGSYGVVKAYLKNGFTGNIISKYTNVTIKDNPNKFYVYRDVLLNSDNIKTDAVGQYVLLIIRQGEVKSIEVRKDSVVNDRIIIYDKDTEETGVAFESFEIENQGYWKQAEDVYFEFVNTRFDNSNSKLFSITKDLDRNPIIELISGWQELLSEYQDDSFTITYAKTNGNKTLIVEDKEVTIKDPNIEKAKNTSQIKGGYTPTYDLTRQMYKSIQEGRTMWSAISIEDYKILSKEHKDVLASVAYDVDSKELSQVNSHLNSLSQPNLNSWEIAVSFVDLIGSIPNQVLIDSVMELLNDRKLQIFKIRYVEPVILKANYKIKIQTVGDSFIITKNEVIKIVEKLYQNIDKYGKLPISDSKIISALQNMSRNVYSVELERTMSGNINPFSYTTLGDITLELEVI